MNLFTFFNSYPGMYISQAFCHSIVASIISDQALRAWDVADPGVRQRFRLIVVLAPVFSFPLYQLFNQERGSLPFRLSALFDVNRWMNMEIWGFVSVGSLFLFLLAATSLVFVFQELLPVLMHVLQSKTIEHSAVRREDDPFIQQCARALSIPVPEVYILEDDDLVIFSTTGNNGAIFLSEGLIKSLSPEELRASLAHELGHIARSRKPVLLGVFLLRMLMFFNPVSLVEFRRAVRNEEKICDDIAVSLTGRPDALIKALKKFFPVRPPVEAVSVSKSLLTPVNIEDYSHIMQLESRIARLNAGSPDRSGGQWLLFSATVLVVLIINYFIV